MRFLFLLILFTASAVARPVGYQGAINGISSTKSNQSENTIHYSPHHYYSVGFRSFYSEKFKFNGVYGAYLLKRWNFKKAQSNIFTYGSLGADSHKNFMHHYGVQGDYETRRIYTLYNYQEYRGKNILENNHTVRMGFAPYLAKFNEINLWLIGEYNSKNGRVTPLARMFYKNVLGEFGYNPGGDILFNLMVQMIY